MNRLFLYLAIGIFLCSCHSNEPDFTKRPDSSIPHSKYIEPTYEELCAMWDADTTLANVQADTLTLPNGAYYKCRVSCPAMDSNGGQWYQLYSSKYHGIEHIFMSIIQWHCGDIPHAGYYTTANPNDEIVIEVPYYIDLGIEFIEEDCYAERAKCMFYDFKRLPGHPNVIGIDDYACSWRILFTYKDLEGIRHYVYTEGHPED